MNTIFLPKFNNLNFNKGLIKTNPSNRLSFLSENDYDFFEKSEVKLERGQFKKFGQVFNRNRTAFFRSDLKWDVLFDYFKDKYKDCPKVNIYDYACSLGFEAYTISILVQETQENPQRFFPIIAKDIEKGIIRKNIADQQDNYCRIYDTMVQKKLKLFYPSLSQSNKYFDIIFDIDCDIIHLKNTATEPVEFSYGNILNDVDKIDDENPSIVFARNMWLYVDKSEYDEFAKNLYKKLKKGSCVVIGEADLTFNKFNSIKNNLIEAGFKPVLESANADCYGTNGTLVYEK